MVKEVTKTIKLKLLVDKKQAQQLLAVSMLYRDVCQYVSDWIFEHDFVLNFMTLQKEIYHDIREKYPLNSQMVISALKTTTARYKTTKEQLAQKPYRYQDEKGRWVEIKRTLEWLQKPVHFRAPQCDQVRNRNYRLLKDGRIALSTLDGPIKVAYQAPPAWKEHLNDGWTIGTAKIIRQKKCWYMCIPMKKDLPEVEDSSIKTIVGIDRGFNFIIAAADSKGKSTFQSGRAIMHKRHHFAELRKRLQIHNTQGSKRKIRAIGQRENRWMSDVNHRISKALVDQYGKGTLFVLEDLTGVSFSEENLRRRKQQKQDLRSWAFYQLEQFLSYKAECAGAKVIKVSPRYTSQRCPKCGIIEKKHRHHDTHEYRCTCGYHTNDDRVGALNLLELGRRYLAGDQHPRYSKSKKVAIDK